MIMITLSYLDSLPISPCLESPGAVLAVHPLPRMPAFVPSLEGAKCGRPGQELLIEIGSLESFRGDFTTH